MRYIALLLVLFTWLAPQEAQAQSAAPVTLYCGDPPVPCGTSGNPLPVVVDGGGGGGTSATYGAAFPSTGTPSGGTDGTNFQPLVVDTTTHYLQVDVKAGGAGGGAVYGPTAVGTAAANPPVLTGGTADGTGTGAVNVWKIVSGVGYANTAQINGITVLTGAGAVGTGSARVAVGQDTTTIAGSAPGTAGTASANVVTVQGVTSMTPVQVSQATAANLNATVVPATATNLKSQVSIASGGVASGSFASGALATGSIAAGAVSAGAFVSGSVLSGAFASGALASGSIAAGAQVDLLTMRGSATGGTAAADSIMIGGTYNSSAPILTNAQQASLQLDASGNLDVNIKAGAGSGGTALADQATFTQGTTSETPLGCLYIASYSAGTAGKSTVVQCDSTGHPLVNPGTLATWGLVALGGGTAPTNTLAIGAEYLSSSPSYSTGQVGALQMTAAGSLHTTVDNSATQVTPGNGISAPTGTAPSTSSPVTSFNEMYNGSTWDAMQDDANKSLKVAPQASPVGGALSSTWLASAASNNATNVKNAAGTLYTITVTQSTTTAMELKLYNTSSSPTCSSATGLVDIIPIPSNAISPGYHIPYPVGRAFSTGISFCLVAFGAPAAGTDNGNAVTGATVSMTYD